MSRVRKPDRCGCDRESSRPRWSGRVLLERVPRCLTYAAGANAERHAAESQRLETADNVAEARERTINVDPALKPPGSDDVARRAAVQVRQELEEVGLRIHDVYRPEPHVPWLGEIDPS
jgi:hypothetical protein